jgi:dihydrolipoamide dehydrogenase
MDTGESYDLTVIGAGPGGYVAAVRAAQLGMKVVCVEKGEQPGGVCLNVGCIPSKALLDSSELYSLAGHQFGQHGLRVESVTVDLQAMMARKDRVVRELSDGVRKLLESHGVRLLRGTATLRGSEEVEVRTDSPERTATAPTLLKTRFILLATGSVPVDVPGLPFDGERIVSSTEALAFDVIPGRLGIVGGGYIGLELGSVWNRLGSKVMVIEMMPRIAMTLDGQIGRTLQRALSRQGIEFRMETRVVRADISDDGVQVTMELGERRETARFDRLLVAVGRRPWTQGLRLDEVGVQCDPRTGRVLVDAAYRTSIHSIYAIGDLAAGPMLAHKASAEGIAAVECMAGLPGEVNYDTIPAIVYTSPEVAAVGLTEEQVKERCIAHRIGAFPFSGVGRARCMGETDGLVKIIAHARTDRILGVHILGPRASELIAECVLAMEFCARAEDLARTIHGHPTFSEALHEAALSLWKSPFEPK